MSVRPIDSNEFRRLAANSPFDIDVSDRPMHFLVDVVHARYILNLEMYHSSDNRQLLIEIQGDAQPIAVLKDLLSDWVTEE